VEVQVAAVNPVQSKSATEAPTVGFRRSAHTPACQTATTLVYLARHGETASNVLRRYAGYSAEPLTERGQSQASGLAAELALAGIREIWTSEVVRARETAEVIGRILSVPTVSDSRLNEMRLGPWEGLTESEVAQRFPNEHALWCALPERLALAGRETLSTVAARVNAAVDSASRRPHPVLLVTHVAPIRVAVLSALRLPFSLYKQVRVGNGNTVMVQRDAGDVRRLGAARSLQFELASAQTDSSLA